MKRTHIFLCTMLAAILACQTQPSPPPTIIVTQVVEATRTPAPTSTPLWVGGEMLTNVWERGISVDEGAMPNMRTTRVLDWHRGRGMAGWSQLVTIPRPESYDCTFRVSTRGLHLSAIVTASLRYRVSSQMEDGSSVLLLDDSRYQTGYYEAPVRLGSDDKLLNVLVTVVKPDIFDAIQYQLVDASLWCSIRINRKANE